MSGFSTKLRDRLHGLLSDVVVEANSLDGFGNVQEKIAKIRSVPFLNDRIEAMTDLAKSTREALERDAEIRAPVETRVQLAMPDLDRVDAACAARTFTRRFILVVLNKTNPIFSRAGGGARRCRLQPTFVDSRP